MLGEIPQVITTVEDLSAVGKYTTVVVCGAEPAKKLLQDKSLKITEKAGVVVRHKINDYDVNVVCQLSPAFVIRETTLKGGKAEKSQRLWVDVWSMVSDVIGGSITDPPETHLWDTDTAMEVLDHLIVHPGDSAYDYETWGDAGALRPELCSDFRIVSVGVAWRGPDGEAHAGSFLFDRPGEASPRLRDKWLEYLRRPAVNVAHYAKYEHKCNIKRFGATYPARDTILQLHALDELADGKLDRVMVRCGIHWGAFKAEFDETRKDPMRAKVKTLLRYNGLDALATLLCHDYQEAELGRTERLTKVARQNEIICMDLAEQEMDGMYVNAVSLGDQRKRIAAEAAKADRDFQSLPQVRNVCRWAVENIKSKKKEDPDEMEFNTRSVPMMHRLLFDEFKIPRSKLEVKVKGEKKIKARKDDLRPLEREYPVLTVLNKSRSLKSMSGMLDTYENFIGPTGCVHTNYSQTTVVTGRLNSTNPPLQNIPKKDPIRVIFASRFGDDGVLLAADYAQQEPRLIAGWSGDQKMIHALVNGLDLHAYVGSLIFDIPYEKIVEIHKTGAHCEERDVGKRMNLGIAYGQTEYGLSDKTGASLAQAQQWLKKYDERFPGIAAWRRKFHEQAWTKGYVEDLFGARRHLPDAQSGDKWARERAFRQAGNFPVQGTAYRFTQIAIHSTKDLQREHCGDRALVVGQVHDSIIVDVHRDVVRTAYKCLVSGMLVHNIAPYWKGRGCPMKVDVSVGRNLYDLVPYSRIGEVLAV